MILVSNDDGITAPGIRVLVNTMKTIGEVVVVAPDSPQSAKGHAITIDDPLRLKKSDIFDGVEAYECSGTPADCVKIARSVVLKGREIDLAVSGINHGSNASVNIIYSGTMSAAMEASLEGIRSIGFSLMDFDYDADFSPAVPFVSSLSKWMLENQPEGALLLNVNFPKLEGDLKEYKGMKLCKQANARWVEAYHEVEDPRGRKFYWLTGEFQNNDPDPNADINALNEGYVSVVPAHHDLTSYPALEGNLKEINKL